MRPPQCPYHSAQVGRSHASITPRRWLVGRQYYSAHVSEAVRSGSNYLHGSVGVAKSDHASKLGWGLAGFGAGLCKIHARITRRILNVDPASIRLRTLTVVGCQY